MKNTDVLDRLTDAIERNVSQMDTANRLLNILYSDIHNLRKVSEEINQKLEKIIEGQNE